MKFCEFINKLFDNSCETNQERYIRVIFSALCGEDEPFKTNNDKKNSKHLPQGLAGDDPGYRKRLFNGKNKLYKGLPNPAKEYIRQHHNEDTFIAFLEKDVTSEFPELCRAFDISDTVDRTVVFKSIFEQFMNFAMNKADEVDCVIPDTVRKLSKNSTATVPSSAQLQSATNSANKEVPSDSSKKATVPKTQRRSGYQKNKGFIGGTKASCGFNLTVGGTSGSCDPKAEPDIGIEENCDMSTWYK